jgi:hypothetical protein
MDEADHRGHGNAASLRAHLGAVAMDDLGLFLQHQNDRSPRRHDAQRLETGVEQEAPGHAVFTSGPESVPMARSRSRAFVSGRSTRYRVRHHSKYETRSAGFGAMLSPYAVSSRKRR